MSTKIYNGRRVSLEFSQACQALTCPDLMKEMFQQIASIRAGMVYELGLELRTLQAFRNAQIPGFGPDSAAEAKPAMAVSDAIFKICNDHFLKARGFSYKKRMDVENFLMVKADPLSHTGTLVGLFFTQTELLSIIENVVPLADYHYQNNTDKPDAISEAEWEERSRSWDKALPSSWIESGFLQIQYGDSTPLSVFDTYLATEKLQKEVEDRADFAFRTKRVPRLLVVNALMHEYGLRQEEGLKISELVTGFADYRQTSEAKARMDELLQQCDGLIARAEEFDDHLTASVDLDIVESLMQS